MSHVSWCFSATLANPHLECVQVRQRALFLQPQSSNQSKTQAQIVRSCKALSERKIKRGSLKRLLDPGCGERGNLGGQVNPTTRLPAVGKRKASAQGKSFSPPRQLQTLARLTIENLSICYSISQLLLTRLTRSFVRSSGSTMARMDTDWLAYITDVQSDDEVMDHAGSDSEGSQSPKAQDGQESDDDGHVDTGHAPGTISEKKRAQNEVFAAFAATSTAESTAKEVRESIRNATDDDLSIRNILAKQENSASITNPRDYQTELFRKAKDENIIAVLDTGSGKTHIATLLLRHILDVELEGRAKGKPPKIAFFLVRN
jgi:hypothetical protein